MNENSLMNYLIYKSTFAPPLYQRVGITTIIKSMGRPSTNAAKFADRMERWPKMTTKEIHAADKLSLHCIEHYCKTYGILTVDSQKSIKASRIKAWKDKTIREIAEKEGLSISAVWNYCDYHGIQPKRSTVKRGRKPNVAR